MRQLEFSGPSSLDVNSAGTYKVKPSIAGGTFEASGSYRKAGYEGSIDQSIELAEGGADGLVAASTTKCSLKVSAKLIPRLLWGSFMPGVHSVDLTALVNLLVGELLARSKWSSDFSRRARPCIP